MIELLKKEVRALRPMALLIVAFFAALFVYGMVAEFPDMPDDSSRESEVAGMLVFIALFATMTGAGLLVSESNDGTLRFLDALPISRTRIFFTKIIAAIVVLLLVPLLGLGLDMFSAMAEHQSTSAPFDWRSAAVLFAQTSVTAIYVLSFAAMLSFTRQWFALVVGFAFWGFLWLRVNNIAWTGLLDPHEMMAATRFPWRHAAAALGVSTISLGFAWLGFQSLGDRIEHTMDRARRSRFAGVVRLVGVALVPVAWIGAFFYLGKLLLPTAQKAASEHIGEKSFATEQTQRFEFVFREGQRKEAKQLIGKADGIHDQVTAFMGASPVPGRIVVDLGSAVVEHAAGQTTWTKIRMPLGLGLNMHELEAVLGHETTHVYIEQLSDGAMARHFPDARFFHEGLATFIEHKFFSTPDEQRKMRRLAAAAQSRAKVPFETLVSNESLSKERDGNLVYPLGEVFCQALVETHGDDAPGKLLRAFARPHAPAGLSGVAWWRDAMQACGFSLESVTAAYDADLDRAMKEEAEFIAKFPKLTARVEVVGSAIVIHPQFVGVAPGKVVCMLPEAIMGESILSAGEDGTIHLSRSKYPGPKLRYTLGWDAEELRWPLFETWVETTL